MKRKIFISLLSILLVGLIALGLVACGKSSKWKKEDVTLKEWGQVEGNYGFISETENYYYFINGVGTSEQDNAFGVPVKGSLMAAKKDFSESCIVVPKLFVATDYKQGLAIFGDYVYYGTPCTDKDSSGAIAKSKMTFARTKLDGTDTTEYFTISSLSAEYRICQAQNGDVYIVYYDSENTKLVSYNTETKTATDVCATKVDAESESLATYKFTTDGSGKIVYTTTVYSAEYDEEDAKSQGYNRATASYNKVYAYTVGDAKNGDCAGVLVADGSKKDDGSERSLLLTYTISYEKAGYTFIKEADQTNIGAKTYAIANDKLNQTDYKEANKIEIDKPNYLADSSLILGLDEVYVSDATYVKKTTLIDFTSTSEYPVAKVANISKLLAKEGDYIYYTNSSTNLARIKIANVDESVDADVMEQLVSADKMVTGWYSPVVLDGKMFYCDGSTKGCSYVTFVDVSASNAVKEDKDDDGNTTKIYLEGQTQIGKKIDADVATFASETIKAVSSALENGMMTVDGDIDGVPYMEEIKTAKEVYNALTDAQKKLVSEENVKLLNKYIEAERIQAYLIKLKGFEDKSATEKDALEDAFNQAKEQLAELQESADYTYTEITKLFEVNLNWDYQCAREYFEEKND